MVVDAHSDLLLELVHATDRHGVAAPFRERWLSPLRAGGVALQVCAVYVEPGGDAGAGLRAALRQVAAFHAALDDAAAFAVTRAADLTALGEQRIGLLLAVEGLAWLGHDVWPIELLARLGVRIASLTWNEDNAFAGAGGVTPLGERLLSRMAALGIVVDLAHAAPRTVADVLDGAPAAGVVVSHAACRAVREHPRNLSDDQLRALAARDGVLGLMPHPSVVDPQRRTLARFVDHADHAVATMGIEHVGLGGDFLRQITAASGDEPVADSDGVRVDDVLTGLAGPQDYPALLDALRARGYGEREIAALAGGNLLRVLRNALP